MKKTKVLVIEDEGIMALALIRKLEKFGYDIPFTISSGEEAIQMAEKIHFDLILMDIVLEGEMDGIEAASIICELHHVSVIYLTANSDLTIFKRAKATHPAGFILKPFDEEQLQATMNMAIYKSRIQKSSASENVNDMIESERYYIKPIVHNF